MTKTLADYAGRHLPAEMADTLKGSQAAFALAAARICRRFGDAATRVVSGQFDHFAFTRDGFTICSTGYVSRAEASLADALEAQGERYRTMKGRQISEA